MYPVPYRCWCGGSNADYAKLGALEDTACDMECAGDATQSCGGYNAFDLFQYAEVTEPDGDDNCYADNKSDRVFEDKNTDAALTAEVGEGVALSLLFRGFRGKWDPQISTLLLRNKAVVGVALPHALVARDVCLVGKYPTCSARHRRDARANGYA